MNVAQNTVTVGLNAMNALMNGGSLTIYSGSMPAAPEAGLGGAVPLVTFIFGATAFGAPAFASGEETAAGLFVANSVAPTNSGTASFARILKSDGVTPVADLTVGTAGTDIILGSTTIATGINVNMTSFTISMPAS